MSGFYTYGSKLDPAYDCVLNQPCTFTGESCQHGRRSAVTTYWVTLEDTKRTIEFNYNTRIYLPETIEAGKTIGDRPNALSVNWHSPTKWTHAFYATGDCKFTGGDCYLDSTFIADDVLGVLARGGEEALYEHLYELRKAFDRE